MSDGGCAVGWGMIGKLVDVGKVGLGVVESFRFFYFYCEVYDDGYR